MHTQGMYHGGGDDDGDAQGSPATLHEFEDVIGDEINVNPILCSIFVTKDVNNARAIDNDGDGGDRTAQYTPFIVGLAFINITLRSIGWCCFHDTPTLHYTERALVHLGALEVLANDEVKNEATEMCIRCQVPLTVKKMKKAKSDVS